jgi:hypothetical protein
MSKPPVERKPFSRDEFDRCIRAIGHPEMEIRRWIGQQSVAKGKQVAPANFSQMESRAVRMLAIYPEILARFLEIRKHFPRATIDAIRQLTDAEKKAKP